MRTQTHISLSVMALNSPETALTTELTTVLLGNFQINRFNIKGQRIPAYLHHTFSLVRKLQIIEDITRLENGQNVGRTRGTHYMHNTALSLVVPLDVRKKVQRDLTCTTSRFSHHYKDYSIAIRGMSGNERPKLLGNGWRRGVLKRCFTQQ